MASVVDIPIAKLRRRMDARALDGETVKALAASIADMGIMTPLRVRPTSIFESGQPREGWEITTGRHRFEAARKVGLETVPCIVVDDDELHAELAMIDENLCRAELGPADRSAQSARRKVIYLELHPETAAGVAGAHASNRAQGNAAENFSVASFANDTAEKTGKTDRAVRLDVERGEKVCGEALDLVRGTDLDKGSYLDKLKTLTPDEQIAKVKRALSDLARAAERARAEAADKRNQSRIEADVRRRSARVFAERLAEVFSADEWEFVKAQLATSTSKGILAEFTNITGASVLGAED